MRYDMTAIQEATQQMIDSMAAFAREIEDRLNPPMFAFAHEMHAWWFETLPWYRQWWHLVTCRHDLRDFVWQEGGAGE